MLQVRARLWFIAKGCILLPATYLHVGGRQWVGFTNSYFPIIYISNKGEKEN